MGNPSPFAYLALLLWPYVTYRLWRALPPPKALIWTILGGYLLLPEMTAIDFPLIPDLNKTAIPNLAAAVCILWLIGDRFGILPDNPMGKLMILVYVISPFLTVITNPEPLVFKEMTVPGMRFYDSFAAVANQAIYILPMLMARRYLGNPEGSELILKALILGALAYSLPILIEAAISPVLHMWIYGFLQQDFFQSLRYGGYRPVVFLKHGLWLAFYVAASVIATAAVLRYSPPERRPLAFAILGGLVVILVVCKSAGPLFYAVVYGGAVLFLPRRLQLIAAAAVALLVVTYPALRGAHLIPIDEVLGFFGSMDADRAESLKFRLDNEELLLARAEEKPLFGWGGYGRNFEHDPITGRMINIADGGWIIVLGIYGWFGYFAEFGLTALPLILLGREALLQPGRALSPWPCALALILAANMMDLLPNATHVSLTWLIAGTLLGEAERLRRTRKAEARGEVALPLKRTVI